MQTDRALRRLWRSAPRAQDRLQGWHQQEQSDAYYRDFLLHTNASGDFILAPREAFDRIHGMWETTEIYLHLDSYAVIQLFAAGYEPAIFRQPHRVFHADHDRSARLGFAESMTWDRHEAKLSGILRGDESYRLNNADWGLKKEQLPTWRL
jgi:GT2 family glycosyltransferase